MSLHPYRLSPDATVEALVREIVIRVEEMRLDWAYPAVEHDCVSREGPESVCPPPARAVILRT